MKGFSQVDYIIAIGIFLIVFGFVVFYFTNYITPVQNNLKISSLRSRAMSIMDMLFSDSEISLTGTTYVFNIIVTNSEDFMINETKPIINLPSEITRFKFDYIGHPEMNYYATAIYDDNGTFIPYSVNDDMISFLSSFNQYETKRFEIYISDDDYYNNASTVSGTNELKQVVEPAKQIEVVHYGLFRKLKLTSYNKLRMKIGGNFNIRIEVSNTTINDYGGLVPKRTNVVAFEKPILYQNENKTINNGKIIVSTW